MKTYLILGASALLALAVTSCDTPAPVVVNPPTTTTTVTERTTTPDPVFNPGVTQTTKTTTTRSNIP